MTLKKGYSKKINERFTIHIAKGSEEEYESFIKLSLKVHKEEILESYLPRLFYEHPKKEDIVWFYIKDIEKQQIVSMLCLAPLE